MEGIPILNGIFIEKFKNHGNIKVKENDNIKENKNERYVKICSWVLKTWI